MFGIRFMKAEPTRYVMHFKAGKVVREGAGLSFFYWDPSATIVAVPLQSADIPFVFNEVTADFQAITVQGQLTWRVADAKKLAALLDFSVDAKGALRTEDPLKLEERLVQATQVLARGVTEKLSLQEALASSESLGVQVLAGLRKAELVQMLGVEPLALAILGVRPTPEMGRALEAKAREELQRGSDQAIYDRRNAAVEQERRIKENELNTELAVDQKQRQIREARMAADIAIEAQRRALIDTRVENERKDADWRTLTAIAGGNDPKTMIALAFRELAQNAGKIGELNISPDLLQGLLSTKAEKAR